MFGRFKRLARVNRYIRPIIRCFGSFVPKLRLRPRTWLRSAIRLTIGPDCGIFAGTFLFVTNTVTNQELCDWISIVKSDIRQLKYVPKEIVGIVIEDLPQELVQNVDMNLLQGMAFTGSQFNKLIGCRLLFKNTNLEEKHYGMKYKTGRNDDIIAFNPTSCCSAGGIYFAEEKYIDNYNSVNTFRRFVTISDDAQVYVEHNKFKASSVILGEPGSLYLLKSGTGLISLLPKDLRDYAIEKLTEKQAEAININEFEGKVLTGKQFNKLMRGKKLFKNTNAEENHFGLQYFTGRIYDRLPFSPHGSCDAGGIYFTHADKIEQYNGGCKYRRQVTIPDDAQVYIEKDKFKADVVELGPRVPIIK